VDNMKASTEFSDQCHQLIRIGHDFWNRGWSRGTSSNYSCVVGHSRETILITASGLDKGALTGDGFALLNRDGVPLDASQPRSSAETALHVWAIDNGAGSVLHTHSVWATILSQKFLVQRGIWFESLEMLKGFEGITTHASRMWLPIFENSQDIEALSRQVNAYWKSNHGKTLTPAFLIAGHGTYAWGSDIETATRHLEVIEFLLECTARSMTLR
jgi:methylthioribulose-1-phosphate dehydratase